MKGKKQTISRRNYYERLLRKYTYQAESQLNSLEQAAGGIGHHVNADKTEYMCFNQKGDISTLIGGSLKLVDKFTYFGSSISSSENDISLRLAKAWAAIDRLLIIWKLKLSDKIKLNFFQVAVGLSLQYGCITWTLTKCIVKKLDGDCTRNYIEQIREGTSHTAVVVRPPTSYL